MFSDLHHYPGVFHSGSWENLREIQECALREQCEMIIHAGDFCHGPSEAADYVKAYNDFVIPSYHVLGNHDSDNTSYEETLKYYNMPDGHYYFDKGGYRFIICDTNYYCVDGEYIHYDLGNYYQFGAYREYMSPAQLQWLEETIDASPYPCVLISHASFEREAGSVPNWRLVRDIINRANEKRPHQVLLCMNGHHHRDNIRILDQVCYWDVNSVCYDWVEEPHALYPAEYDQEYAKMNHTVVYNDPLYAIVTLEGNTITIEGRKSSMFMGITREMTGNPPFDKMGRPVTPMIQSARITLH